MKNILVLGGAGYIGSHVVRKLKKGGFHPIIFDNLTTGHKESIADDEFIHGDVRSPADLKKAFSSCRIDAVMHFCARSLVAESMQKPWEYFENNVAGGLNVLKAMKESGVEHIIFSSTAATYGQPGKIPIEEDDEQKPVNPYGESKLMFEKMLRWFDEIHGIRYVSLRYFNAAGADDQGNIGEDHKPETHLIPIILQAAGGKRDLVKVYGDDYPTKDGTCIRDYIHVYDLAQAHVLALGYLMDGGRSNTFNMGCQKGFSVKEVIATAQRVTGKSIPVVISGRRPGDPAVLVASSERITGELGWKPVYDLTGIIKTAWSWHEKHPDGYGS